MSDAKIETTSQMRPEVALNPETGRPAGAAQSVVLLIGSTMPIMGAVLLAPVLPSLTQVFPAHAALVPLLLSAPALTVALTAPFAGTIADRVGRKRLLVGALLAYAVLGTAPLYINSFWGILLTRLGVGITEAAIFTCCIALLSDYFFGARRSRVFSWQNVVLSAGALLYVILGGAIGATGWRSPFWLYSGAIVIAVAVATLVWKPKKEEAAGHTSNGPLPPFPFRLLLPPYITTFFGGIIFYSVVIETPFLLVGAGVTAVAVIGLISALNQLGQAIGGLSFRWVARFGVQRLLPIGFTVSGLGLLIIWLGHSVPLTVVGTVCTTLGGGLFVTTLQTWAVAGLPFEQRGRASGGWTTAVFLGNFFSPLIVLALGSIVGGLAPALGVLGIAALLVAASLAVLLPGRPQRSLVQAAPEPI